MRQALLTVLFLFPLYSCTETSTHGLTEDETRLVEAYAGLSLLSESLRGISDSDSVALLLGRMDSTLARHGLTRETFQNELIKLTRSPERFRASLDMMYRNLEEKRAKKAEAKQQDREVRTEK